MRHLTLLVVLPVLVLLGAVAPAGAATSSQFGLHVLAPSPGVAQAEVERDLSRVAGVGAKVARIEFLWAALEPERGRIDQGVLARYDATVAAARARGLKVLLLFRAAPCWAAYAGTGAECTRYGPKDPQDAVRAATLLASRYAADLSGFEVWNEPDHRNELYWAGPDKIERYVALSRALYAPLKAAAPGVPVLAGAFVGGNGLWLEALYKAGFKGTYDQLSVHFYDLTLSALRTTEGVMRKYGDTSPLVLGEVGWSSCLTRRVKVQLGHQCVTRRAQAELTRDLVRILKKAPRVQGVVFFSARDMDGLQFGLYTATGRPKPVLRALRAELRTRKTRRVRDVRLRARRTRGAITVTGTGPAGDFFTVEARSSRARFRAVTRLDARGRIVVRLPPQLGTRGVRVAVRQLWTRRTGYVRVR